MSSQAVPDHTQPAEVPSTPQVDTEQSPRSTLPKTLDKQIAFLYDQAQNLHDLVTQFAAIHAGSMTLFKEMQKPLVRLPLTSEMLRGALDEFCVARECVLSCNRLLAPNT